VLSPGVIAGGLRAALATSHPASVQEAFATPPAAAMVFEGDLVAGIITGQTNAQLGVDADTFTFPAIGRSRPAVVAGGDAAVLMRRSAAGEALIRFLASPRAAAIWASRGGFVSPNINLGRAPVLVAVPVVDLTRIYAGAHLPLDVVGGTALGLAVDAAVAVAGRRGRAHVGDHAGQ
jgi:hypothetical protein